ncbi:MMPL family transporter [Micromonospora coxensis]|uniref:Putative drug exporter of the RND superfamily n=1 Tax=Micromonospora coxensis TaxID=356852 RepID=A0A1C5IT05_9ACTN|nr:MMPL family transporter [Micromonospora coxensis]SCG61450.1 putative drug exporter of the RND superfamily [Micromonospora coxensis]
MERTLDRLGRATAGHPWRTLGLWLLAAVALIAVGPAVGGGFVNDFRIPGAESQRAADLARDAFPEYGAASAEVVWHSPDGDLRTPERQAAITAMTAAIRRQPGVTAVEDPLAGRGVVAPDGRTAVGTVRYGEELGDLGPEAYHRLDAAAGQVRAHGVEVTFRGLVVDLAFEPETGPAEAVGLGVALLVLLVAFGSAVAAGLPILVALAGLVVGTGLMLIAAATTEIPTAAPIVAVMLGLGAGIDYALFVVTRFRAALAEGLPTVAAAGRAVATAGHAVLFAGATVVVAILGLVFTGIPFVGALGVAAALTVAAMMVAALTLLPALLGLLGPRVNLGRLPRRRNPPPGAAETSTSPSARAGTASAASVSAGAASVSAGAASVIKRFGSGNGPDVDPNLLIDTDGSGAGRPGGAGQPGGGVSGERGRPGWWVRWGWHLDRRRVAYGVGATVVLLGLAAPLLTLRLGTPDDGNQPESWPQRQAYDTVRRELGPGWNAPLVLAVHRPAGTPTDGSLARLADALTADPEVALATPPVRSPDGTLALLTVVPRHAPQDQQVADLVHRIRRTVGPSALGPDGARVAVGGQTAYMIDMADAVARRLPWVVLGVVVAGGLLLVAMFRAPLIAVKAALMALLSIGAAYGVLVAVFQWGWGLSLLGVDQPVPIMSVVPMLLFAILFGLSMDYEVFLLSSVQEEYRRTGDPHRAVVAGLAGTGRVITAAATIMAVVFVSFAAIDDTLVKMIGIGLATAVLVDATVIRVVLAPAVLGMLGHRAWWPSVHEPAADARPTPTRTS